LGKEGVSVGTRPKGRVISDPPTVTGGKGEISGTKTLPDIGAIANHRGGDGHVVGGEERKLKIAEDTRSLK